MGYNHIVTTFKQNYCFFLMDYMIVFYETKNLYYNIKDNFLIIF